MLFLGGWTLIPFISIPGLRAEDVGILAVGAKFGVLFGKMILLVIFMMVIRWTLPRLRFDLSLTMVIVNSVLVFYKQTNLPVMLLANASVLVVMLAILPLMPRSTNNRKIRLAGSRFSPLSESEVRTMPTNAMALDDRPVESVRTLGAH